MRVFLSKVMLVCAVLAGGAGQQVHARGAKAARIQDVGFVCVWQYLAVNLMAADYVYIVDPWWNPAVENQAIDRCYRIGQDKKVIAYRMICRHTVEEKIQELQNRKKQLARDLISTDEGVMQKLDGRELIELFS